MSEAKRAGLIEAGWQELLNLGLAVGSSPGRQAAMRAIFMAGAVHAVTLIADVLADIPEGGGLTEAQAATLDGIVDECHELLRRGSQGGGGESDE